MMTKAGLIHGATTTERVRNSAPRDLAQWQAELECHIANNRSRPSYATPAVERLADISDALSEWFEESRGVVR